MAHRTQAHQLQSMSSATSTAAYGQIYEAAYDFQPQEDGEIELKRGDRIRILDPSDANWWRG